MRAIGLLAAVSLTGCVTHTADVTSKPAVPAPQVEPPVAMTTDFAIPVLMYHRICDLTPREARSPLMRDLSVPPAEFDRQIAYLKEEGFKFLLVSEVEQALREGTPLPVKAVAITMDDGYRDNFTEAFPILQKHGARATIFMVTNNFDRPERLAWSDAHIMKRGPVAFQSHTVSHPDLTILADEKLRFELEESKRILETGLGVTIISLAYPAGAFDPRVVIATERAGYLAGWKKGGGAVQPTSASRPFELPRIRVHGRTDLAKFKARVGSGLEIQRQREGADPGLPKTMVR